VAETKLFNLKDITHNVLQLQEVGDFGAQNCQATTNLDAS
jgi:hypothetical protein